MDDERALKDFIRGGGAVFLTLSASYVLAFIYKLIIARGLGPDNLGMFEMMITILGLISVIGGLGLGEGLKRFIPYYKLKNNEYLTGFLRTVMLIQLVTSFAASLLVILLADKITAFFGFPYIFTTLLYIIAFAVPLKKFSSIFKNVLLGHKKVLLAKLGTDVINKIIILVGALGIILLDFGVVELAVVLIVAYTITFVYYLYLYIPLSKQFKTKKKKYEFKRWIKYSLPLIFAGLLGFLLKWTDNLVIGRMLTEGDLGVYSVAFSVAMFLFMGSKIFSTIFLPIMTEYYEKNKDEFKRLFNTVRNWTVLFSLTMASVFILFAEEILLFLFGSEYTQGTESLQVLAAFFVLANYFFFSAKLLHLEEKTQKILYGDIITLLLNLGITIYLVSQIGILGAAIGAGFSYFFIRYFFHLQSKKFIKIGHDPVHLIKSVILTFPAALISYALTTVIYSLADVHFIVYIATAGVFYAMFLVIGIRYLSILKEQDMLLIETVEKYTKTNLDILKKLFFR